jgi:aryl-alcohol dehydrogenase-like predicted oxidoreductase
MMNVTKPISNDHEIRFMLAMLSRQRTQAETLLSPVEASTTQQASNQIMENKKLGNSDLNLTPIGFGAWAIGGGDWAMAWGDQDDNDSIAAIHKALDLGVNWIDTAAVYGLGHSEEVVARALKTTSHKPYVFTKSTLVWDEKGEVSNSQKQIRSECEASLRRLQVEAIDLYQVHWPKPDEHVEEGWSVMADLQREGKSPLDRCLQLQH